MAATTSFPPFRRELLLLAPSFWRSGGGSRLLGRLLGGDELDKATGGGATRLRRLWEAFSKDLVPGNRHEPGLGGVGEPRAGTTTGWDTPTDAADNH